MSDYYYLHSKRSDQRIHIYIPLCLIISNGILCNINHVIMIYIPLCLIISVLSWTSKFRGNHLHSTMSDYFFPRSGRSQNQAFHLHSTMSDYFLPKCRPFVLRQVTFTFHYVWLFLPRCRQPQNSMFHLHSTMSDYFDKVTSFW